jgi:hypothetical protein
VKEKSARVIERERAKGIGSESVTKGDEERQRERKGERGSKIAK